LRSSPTLIVRAASTSASSVSAANASGHASYARASSPTASAEISPAPERVSGLRHLLEPPRATHLGGGTRVRQAVVLREPRRGGQASVRGECAPPLELGQAPGPLGLEHARGAFELVQVRGQALVADGPQVLGPQLVQRREQRAHKRLDLTEHPFDRL
jgi:hypothetical protein